MNIISLSSDMMEERMGWDEVTLTQHLLLRGNANSDSQYLLQKNLKYTEKQGIYGRKS